MTNGCDDGSKGRQELAPWSIHGMVLQTHGMHGIPSSMHRLSMALVPGVQEGGGHHHQGQGVATEIMLSVDVAVGHGHPFWCPPAPGGGGGGAKGFMGMTSIRVRRGGILFLDMEAYLCPKLRSVCLSVSYIRFKTLKYILKRILFCNLCLKVLKEVVFAIFWLQSFINSQNFPLF